MTVVISVGELQGCSSVLLANDETFEGTQTFSLSIESIFPTGNFNSSEMVVIEIQDNDSKRNLSEVPLQTIYIYERKHNIYPLPPLYMHRCHCCPS